MDIQFSTVTPSLLILYFSIWIDHVKAPATLAEGTEAMPPSSQDPISNSKPSLSVVIAFLSILFFLTLTLLLYAKFCRTRASYLDTTTDQIQINKRVVESLPSFRFSCLRGSREDLECAVCLAKFQDIEILRLLPKCKHAFHTDCIDIWLEKHSTCPLCRQRVGPDDFSQLPYSDSLRFLWNVNERGLLEKEPNIVEFYVEREEDLHGSSSRFNIGRISLRRLCDKGSRNINVGEELLPIQHESIMDMDFDDRERIKKGLALHKLNHRIVVSDVVYKNRWSNVSSSDLMFLNSEMVRDASTAYFSSLDLGRSSGQKHSMEIKQNERECSQTVTTLKRVSGFITKDLNANDMRSMSEITVHPRFNEFRNIDTSYAAVAQNNVDGKMKRVWLQIARKTIQWFANRETRLPYGQ